MKVLTADEMRACFEMSVETYDNVSINSFSDREDRSELVILYYCGRHMFFIVHYQNDEIMNAQQYDERKEALEAFVKLSQDYARCYLSNVLDE